jgi:hypothetical protein
MRYVDVYRMWFTNDEGNDVIVHISDTTSGTGTPTFHDMKDSAGKDLIMSANLSSANDAEDKLSIVRSIRFSCSFVSTATYNVNLFVSGEDNRWLVEVFLLSALNPPIFTGFLVPDGAKDILLDDELYGVELTASDFLQSISEVLLRKPDDTIPKGKFSLITYLSWCLQKTFLQLPIKVVYSLREETHNGPDDCFLKMIFEEAMSFETNINEREDCLTVIKKILLGCFITQVSGEWWIVRVDEMTSAPYTIYSFTYDGAYLGNSTADKLKVIGINETINFTGEDPQIYPERKIKYAKQTFRFENFQELICNMTFERGTVSGSITPSEADFISIYPNAGAFPGVGDPDKVYKATDTGIYYRYYGTYSVSPISVQAYNPVECWLNGKNPHGSVINTAVDVPGYVRKIYEGVYELEKILVLPKLPGAGSQHYWKSELFDVSRLDRITFSVDRRLDTDHTGSGTTSDNIFKIRLRGNDGTYWAVIGNPINGRVGSWKQGTGGFPVQDFLYQYQTNSVDETQWTNHSIEVDPVPVSGQIEIMLFQSGVYGLTNDTHFANIQLEYTPIVNGVYGKATGQYHQVSNSEIRKAKKDEEISISDTASPQWKGGLFRDNGIAHIRIGRVYDYRYGPNNLLGLDKFGAYQVFALWNQYNRIINKIQGTLSGLNTNTAAVPSFIHKFQLTDPSTATDGKLFQMLSFDMDLSTCQWSATFSDVWTNEEKDYSSYHEFKYTTK